MADIIRQPAELERTLHLVISLDRSVHRGAFMPAMIPNTVDPRAPTSERRVFDLLKCIPHSEQWTVLHSLGLSNSYSGEYGEIDFVVIIPDNGIVCLEVKGGGVSCTNGKWSTVDQHGARHDYKRSPFTQVQEGMWKL